MEADRRKKIAILAALQEFDENPEEMLPVFYNTCSTEELAMLGLAITGKQKKRVRADETEKSNFDRPTRIQRYWEDVVPMYSFKEFRSHFRMNRSTFEFVTTTFGNYLHKRKVQTPDISIGKKALLSIWVLATPDSYRSIADRFGVSKSTAHFCVMEFVSAFSCQQKDFIRWPTKEESKITMEEIEDAYGFPGVVGMVDGCHIDIKEPQENKESYYNRKGRTSILLQGTCDQKRKFSNICVGWPGSVHDARVWRNSSLGRALTKELVLPFDGHILADSAYPLETYLLTPFKDNGHQTRIQVKYNKIHSSARSLIERAFGQLKCKFRRLHYLDMAKMDMISNVISACCVLHNIILNMSDEEDEIEENNFESDECFHSSVSNFAASRKRDRIALLL